VRKQWKVPWNDCVLILQTDAEAQPSAVVMTGAAVSHKTFQGLVVISAIVRRLIIELKETNSPEILRS